MHRLGSPRFASLPSADEPGVSTLSSSGQVCQTAVSCWRKSQLIDRHTSLRGEWDGQLKSISGIAARLGISHKEIALMVVPVQRTRDNVFLSLAKPPSHASLFFSLILHTHLFHAIRLLSHDLHGWTFKRRWRQKKEKSWRVRFR